MNFFSSKPGPGGKPVVTQPEHAHILKSEAAEHPLQATRGKRSIPSLDGLRAIAVLMVIISHFNAWSPFAKTGRVHLLSVMLGQGGLGVTVFFVISGFLITTLLLEERERRGTIHLRRFYFRRAMRIFPPYYVYLGVAWLAAYLTSHSVSSRYLLVSAAYLSNYYPYRLLSGSGDWYLTHTWSLSVEEQFYLVWPFLLLLVRGRNTIRLAIAILIAAPLARLYMVHLLPMYGPADQWLRLLHTTLDLLVFGALPAFLLRSGRFRKEVQRLFQPPLLLGAVLFLLASGGIESHVAKWMWGFLGVSLTGACVALLLLWTVLRPATPAGRMLNWAPLRHIGLISYSLYLWQQLFLSPFWAPSGWRNLLAVFAAAEASFWLVERPSLRLRDWLEVRLHLRQAA